MNRQLPFFLLCLVSLTISAQSDVSKYYLANPGFDTDFDHAAQATDRVAQELCPVGGWTAALSADYTIAGVYEFGFAGAFNGASVPAQGYDNEAGGALALSTGWEQTFCYYQTLTLPAGTYTINVPTYNGKTATKGTSQLAWIPTSGTSVVSSLANYPAKTWQVDQITFTLTRNTTGKLQIGYKAATGPSSNSACLLIDYVQILGKDMAVNKTTLRTTLNTAKRQYGEGTGIGAEILKNVIDQAQVVYDNTEATMPEVLEATYNLTQALETFNWQNASEANPLDCTKYLQNPSFETNGTEGWTVKGMAQQNNSVFSRKAGTYYLESWVNIGQQLGNVSVTQTLRNLPRGNYRLLANALHIQQSASGSTTNKGAAQTGAYLFAGVSKMEVTTMKTYTLNFAVVDEQSDLEVGLKTEDATGNWLCVDNFKLQYVGAVSAADVAAEVQKLVDLAQEYLDRGIQQTASTPLTEAMQTARQALEGTGTDGEGNTLYDESALAAAREALQAAMATAEASLQRYNALQERIDYAQKVLTWWEGVARKATTWNLLQTAVNTAMEQMKDYTLTDAQLTSAVNTLNTRIKSVDKKIYCSGNACGTDAQLKVATNQWCYDRSMQSKHWILFWEQGYGTEPPSAVPGILENADKIFELYAGELGFITINEGKSKTDTYKMIIRLRYTTEWEASGSGIDDQIGLLTLSNGAHTSRSGQTVAHEIGHCFQYQTHCDNGNQNGWMYNWGSSTLNVFWEMCAQWQAYKYYPAMQFDNEWLSNTLNGLHRHPLAMDLRYNNYFIQDYFCHRYGMDFVGRLWNESRNPEDPLQAYMRLTMTGTTAQKLDQLGDEMWEYGARMTTFDLDPIREQGKATIGKRNQTSLTKDKEAWWWPQQNNCIENWGNNAIRVNAPATDKTLYVEFEGQAGAEGYVGNNMAKAGWKLGFVALKKDGTRVYGDITTATADDPFQTVAFECPAGCTYVWLVVSGAPTSYWTRDWLSWSEEGDIEQWPYRVKFYQTNVYGNPNINTYPTAVSDMAAADRSRTEDDNVYSLDGRIIRRGSTSLDGLPRGLYVVHGRKVMR